MSNYPDDVTPGKFEKAMEGLGYRSCEACGADLDKWGACPDCAARPDKERWLNEILSRPPEVEEDFLDEYGF